MGGSTKQTQQSQQQNTSSNTVNPQQLAMLQGNYAGATTRANSLVPYTGQLTAGFTPTQLQAQGLLGNVATDPTYQANNTAATNSIQGILGSNPNTTVTASPITTPTVSAGMLPDVDLSKYLSPYTNDVINTSIAQNERARQIAQTQQNEQATAGNAFGGSRSGVANALTNQLYDQNDQSNIANLNNQNYAQAISAAQSDLARELAAAQSNQSAGLNANEFNATQNTNAQQASINNALAQAGLQLNAAGQLVSTNNAALQTAATQGGILGAVGDAQQQQNQSALTNAYNAYTQGQQLTVEQQQLLNSALGLIPNQQTITSNGSGTNVQNTTSGDVLGGILGTIVGGAKIGQSIYGGG